MATHLTLLSLSLCSERAVTAPWVTPSFSVRNASSASLNPPATQITTTDIKYSSLVLEDKRLTTPIVSSLEPCVTHKLFFKIQYQLRQDHILIVQQMYLQLSNNIHRGWNLRTIDKSLYRQILSATLISQIDLGRISWNPAWAGVNTCRLIVLT